MTRIMHATDVHGSKVVWKKFLRSGLDNDCDVIMMSGDLTGKAITAIIERKPGEWFCDVYGSDRVIRSKEELERFMDMSRGRGHYPFVTTSEELQELQGAQKKVDALFVRLVKESLRQWLKLVEERVPRRVKVILNPGNDDSMSVDSLIKESDRVIYPLGEVVQIDDRYEMISCAWSNPTPWKTPRECDEEELYRKLEKDFNRVSNYDNLICNFHAPPYNTKLDLAPKLTKDLKPVTRGGMPFMIHVGSTAVRKSIEKYHPVLGLHGHIHESSGFERLGRTLCINPGSEYESGIMRGYVINLPKLSFYRVEG